MEIIITFFVFILFFLALGLGLLFQGKPLKGSCGGMSTLMGDKECQICGGNPSKCEEEQQKNSDTKNLAYDASNNKS